MTQLKKYVFVIVSFIEYTLKNNQHSYPPHFSSLVSVYEEYVHKNQQLHLPLQEIEGQWLSHGQSGGLFSHRIY